MFVPDAKDIISLIQLKSQRPCLKSSDVDRNTVYVYRSVLERSEQYTAVPQQSQYYEQGVESYQCYSSACTHVVQISIVLN